MSAGRLRARGALRLGLVVLVFSAFPCSSYLPASRIPPPRASSAFGKHPMQLSFVPVSTEPIIFTRLGAGTGGDKKRPEGIGARIMRFIKWILRVQFKIELEDTPATGVLSDQNITLIDDRAITSTKQPEGPRWAIPANTTDLSGKWKPMVTSEFKQRYDEYLKNCSQSAIFRKLVLSTLGLTEDEIEQNGRNLTITGKNPAGSWKRTLVASGADLDTADYEPLEVEIIDPDSDLVKVEAWWEEQGTVHKSILSGKPRVDGGIFETLRYLENESVLVTESLFHPSPESKGSFRPGFVKWRFQRMS